MKQLIMKYRSLALGILLGSVMTGTAFAEPVHINSEAALDRRIIDSSAPNLLVLCKDEAQCQAVKNLLSQAEKHPKVLSAVQEARAAGNAAVSFAYADEASLPELFHGWDEADSLVCKQDPSKKEEECANLAYPVFIVKNAPQSSGSGSGPLRTGVQELSRGEASLEEIVGMAIFAQGVPSSSQ